MMPFANSQLPISSPATLRTARLCGGGVDFVKSVI